MPIRNKRRYQRFSLRYRVRLKFISEGRDVELEGVTKNLSIGGVLLDSPTWISERCPVNFTVIAEGGQVIWPLAFAGKGKVVRVEADPPGSGYVIALNCVQPIECYRAESKVKGGTTLARSN